MIGNKSQEVTDVFLPFNVKERKVLICEVEVEGNIRENKTIYIPNYNRVTDLKLPVIGTKDYRILVQAIQLGVNIISVSCVESKEDILEVRKVLGSKGSHIKIFAKL